jgi:TolB-like protein/DNA-binding winged helix-turn-helix (wHTH) protein
MYSESGEQERFAVDDLIVDVGTRQVLRNGAVLALPKLSFEFLMALIHAAPDVVTTEQLAERVWVGRVVGNETITQRVRLLRKSLGDDANEPRYVGLVRGEGYRLLVDVVAAPPGQGASAGRGKPVYARRGAWLIAAAAVSAIAVGWFLLAWIGKEAAPAGSPRIAVLPFVNLSDDPMQEYFADGLTEELINELSHIPNLRVAGRTSSFAFKDRNPAFHEAGEALGVDHILEGSVRWGGGETRVTAQLIAVADGFHLWSETYAFALEDTFAIQEEIARAVVAALSLELGMSDPPRLRPTHSGPAYAHFLRAQALFWNHTPETTERAIDEYLRAVEQDPRFVRAWVGLGFAYGGRSRDPTRTVAALHDMATVAQRALELAPEYWEAHALNAWVQMSYHDFRQAEASMARAIALRGRTPNVQEGSGCPVACYFQQIGRVSDALAEARRIQEIDPIAISADQSSWLYLLGRRDDAIGEYRRVKDMVVRPFHTGQIELWLAMEDPDPSGMNERIARTPLAGKWGKPEEMLVVLDELDRADRILPRGSRAMLAMYATIHGDDALALRLLRQEFMRPGFGAYFLMWHPALRRVRASEGFGEFVTELGLVDAWRETGEWGDFCRARADDAVNCQ